MRPYCNGYARIRNENGPIYTIKADEIEWELVESSERQMGLEHHYQAVLDHPDLGIITWNLWEYPEGVENHRATEVNGLDLIADFDYGLEHEDDSEDEDNQDSVHEVVRWFLQHYEDPAIRTPYESSEGGYQYIWGGPVDAREAIFEGFPYLDEQVIEAAVSEIEQHGFEWVPIPEESDYDTPDEPVEENDEREPIDDGVELIPGQIPGITFLIRDDGVIDVAPTGTPTQDDQSEISAISEVIVQACDDLLGALQGSNAYATIAETARRYQRALTDEPKSLDMIYALGVRLESARGRLQKEIDSGDYPDMATATGEALDSILALHGPMIYSTERGKILLSHAHEYARTVGVTERFKINAKEFANAVYYHNGLVSDNVRKIIAEVNQDIGEGPHPERSAAVAGTANRNLLVAVGIMAMGAMGAAITGTIGNAFTASVPGALFATAVTEGSNVAWDFLSTHSNLLKELVAASGPDLSWLNAVLDLVRTRVVRR